jgi:hypothetical protein
MNNSYLDISDNVIDNFEKSINAFVLIVQK